MTPEERAAFFDILTAHERTVEICRACAETTRDLAAEVKRGGVPAREHLGATITEAENVLNDLRAVTAEIARLRASVGRGR